jgi:enoyl-CoA hydratase/carnithine racemase
MSTVTLEITNNIARLTLNRAEKRNALTQAMWQQVADYCDELSKNIHVKVLVVGATGNKAFSAGADIEELTEIIQDSTRLKTNNKIVQLAQQKLQQLNIPTIAAINGVCVGGGMGIAMCCDFRICVNHAKFSITPAKLGLLYSIEDTKRVVELVGVARAKELLYLGKVISAEQALKWGLVSTSVDEVYLGETVNSMVVQLLSVSSYSISGIKQTLGYISSKSTFEESNIRALFDNAFEHEDFKEGAQAFLQKRPPEFK